METVQHYDKEELESILKQLSESDEYGTILRAKGMLEDKEGKWMYFDLVPHEYEIREGQPTYLSLIHICALEKNLYMKV